LIENHDAPAAESFFVCGGSKHQQRNLFYAVGKVQPIKELWDMLAASGKFLRVPLFAIRPAACIHRRFNVNQMLFLWVEGDDVEFAIPTPSGSLTNVDVLADKISLVLVPFACQLFEKVCHPRTPTK
jgi:hypothetical protein